MSRGRPRGFDVDRVLDQAMVMFWRHGYRATSLDDLTQEMGLSRPSIYAAFGDKEQLFLRAIDRYIEQFATCAVKMLEAEPDAWAAIKALLDAVVDQLSDPTLPAGCFRVNSTLECQGLSDVIERKLIEYQTRFFEGVLYDRLRRAQVEGQIPIQEDVQALARFFAGVINGTAVLARAHADPVMLRQIVSTAMRAWPA